MWDPTCAELGEGLEAFDPAEAADVYGRVRAAIGDGHASAIDPAQHAQYVTLTVLERRQNRVDRYAAWIEHAAGYFVLTDRTLTLVAVSPEYAQMLGYDHPAELRGVPGLYFAADRVLTERRLREHAPAHEAVTLLRRRDGSTVGFRYAVRRITIGRRVLRLASGSPLSDVPS